MTTKTTPTREQLVDELHQIIEARDYTERDAFRLIVSFIDVSPAIAYSLGAHIHDVIQDIYTAAEVAHQAEARAQGRATGEPLEYLVDVNYSEVIANAYERAFFNPDTSDLYGGPDGIHDDLAALEACVGFLRAMADVEESGATNVTPITGRKH